LVSPVLLYRVRTILVIGLLNRPYTKTVLKETAMEVNRVNSGSLLENRLPDGSRILVDSCNGRVIALNASAGAAWDACSAPTSLAQVAEDMRRSLHLDVSEEVAQEAILQLQENHLVYSDAALPSGFSRRSFITKLGAAAVPLVVCMTMSEQRAYARMANSDPKAREHHPHHRIRR
jgi:hypothetical protein